MRTKIFAALFGFTFILLAGQAAAATAKARAPARNQASETELDRSNEIAQQLAKKFPMMKITSVQKAPIDGLYEVTMGKKVAYVDGKSQYFLFGHIFDMVSQEDVTQARLDDMNRVDVTALQLDKAIKIVKGNGSRVFAVFSDPDCPYCRLLENNLAGVDNYTMYVLLYPIAELHPEGAAHAKAIWCARDKQAAWHDFMISSKLPADDTKDCVAPLADIASVAAKLGITGTPTLVRGDGKLVGGALPGNMLDQFLSGGNAPPPIPVRVK